MGIGQRTSMCLLTEKYPKSVYRPQFPEPAVPAYRLARNRFPSHRYLRRFFYDAHLANS
jgi:hypothetical protein